MHAAKEVQLLTDQQLQDGKKLQLLQKQLDKMLRTKKSEEHQEPVDYARYFRKAEKKLKKMKEAEEEQIINMFMEFTTYDKNRPPVTTSIVQKYLRELMHEIWAQVVPTTCPHCHEKSPAFRKDGYTKIF